MNKILISVVSPSIRPEGLKIVKESLEKQTFPCNSFEWLVELGIQSQGHTLNQAYNRMIKRAKGELIVSVQDYMKLTPDYLQKFWDAYQKEPRTFFTAPVGKVDNLEYTGSPRWDWRAFSDDINESGMRDCRWDNWEIDSGCAPKSALFEIGGFDEELDANWSCDNVNVGCRAELAGYKFKNLFINPSIVYDHDAYIEHPFRSKFKPIFNNMRMDEFRQGLKIDYLS